MARGKSVVFVHVLGVILLVGEQAPLSVFGGAGVGVFPAGRVFKHLNQESVGDDAFHQLAGSLKRPGIVLGEPVGQETSRDGEVSHPVAQKIQPGAQVVGTVEADDVIGGPKFGFKKGPLNPVVGDAPLVAQLIPLLVEVLVPGRQPQRADGDDPQQGPLFPAGRPDPKLLLIADLSLQPGPKTRPGVGVSVGHCSGRRVFPGAKAPRAQGRQKEGR
jgi:hypothetical protein